MAGLPPLGGAPPPAHKPRAINRANVTPGPPSSRAREQDPGYAAAQAQSQAQQQISAASQSVEDARRDADQQIDQIKDSYDSQSEAEYARQEAAFEKQRLQGYEKLKELKRDQEREISRARDTAERDLDKQNNYYRDTEYANERKGEEKLKEIQVEQGRINEHAKATKDQDTSLEQDMYSREFQAQHESHEQSLNKLREENRQEYERTRQNLTEATAQEKDSFEHQFQDRFNANDKILKNLYDRANKGIREVRQDTSLGLAAYARRQKDPFYRMLDLDVNVQDEGDHYRLTATIPEHEQQHVSVSVKGNQLVLSGSRHNEEKLELEPGRTQGTNSFQSYLETYPITWPVDANKMTRHFEGDQLIVRIPKKMEYGYQSKQEARVPVPRAKLERPKFPENLPHVSQDPYADPERATSPDGKTKGSGTLS